MGRSGVCVSSSGAAFCVLLHAPTPSRSAPIAIVLKLLQDIFEPPPFRCTIRAHVRQHQYARIATHSLEGHMRSLVRSLVLIVSALLIRSTAASAQATLEVEDFLTMPMTGSVDGKGSNDVLLSRVNTLREEAGGSSRLFISDL